MTEATSSTADQPRPVVHLAAMFGNGTQLHMPAKSWLDQALVRTLILHLTGDAVPERTDDEWLDVVLALHDAAEQA